MQYQKPTFTLPACTGKLSDLEYQFRVGAISRQEYERALKEDARRTVEQQ